jgi:UDP-3-O-[3-hydroxymyristoyl] N-acetylglucosamine deacetylase
MQQKTIMSPISCVGIGLHSGNEVLLTLHPAEEDSGIIFRKENNDKVTDIKALYKNVTSTTLCTAISCENTGESVLTIEHLMAALWGCGIDNLIIEVNGDEVPIMDGSAESFIFMIESAGVKTQEKSRQVLKILKETKIQDGDSWACLKPNANFTANVEINFNNELIGKQSFTFDIKDTLFEKHISRARTFGFEEEVDFLRAQGLIKGGSLDNAIIVAKDKILNEGGLRFKDEFVRHKLLDCLGDLFLAGNRIQGAFEGYKTGHKINNNLLREVFSDHSNYEIIDAI